MRDLAFKRLTAWGELAEDVQERHGQATSPGPSGLSTLAWIGFGLAALVFLLLSP